MGRTSKVVVDGNVIATGEFIYSMAQNRFDRFFLGNKSLGERIHIVGKFTGSRNYECERLEDLLYEGAVVGFYRIGEPDPEIEIYQVRLLNCSRDYSFQAPDLCKFCCDFVGVPEKDPNVQLEIQIIET